jgi:hypothetical protein
MNEGHLSDDRLIEICLNASTPVEQAHLAICRRCEARRLEIVADPREARRRRHRRTAGRRVFQRHGSRRQHASILHPGGGRNGRARLASAVPRPAAPRASS